jgi:hypothetical protein
MLKPATAMLVLGLLLLLLEGVAGGTPGGATSGPFNVPARRIDIQPDSTGGLVEGQIVDALSQARAALVAQPAGDVLIQLPPGEFAINTTGTPFELSNIAPAVGYSLTIAGAGAAETVLRFDGLFDVISGKNTSRVRFRDLSFARQRLTTSQGVVVDADATSVTVKIQDGYPLPPAIMGDPKRLTAGAGRWLRRYHQAASGACEIITDSSDGKVWPPTRNVQVKWLNASLASTNGDSSLWKFGGVSWRFGANSEKIYSKGDIVGIKSKHAGQSFFFFGGGDISFTRTTWTEHSRGVLRGGISDITFQDTAVRKSSLAPTYGLAPCLATPGGGPQLGQPDDPPIDRIVVRNHTSEGTGDDAIALFNVKTGELAGNHLNDSFARGIYLYKSTPTLGPGNVLERCSIFHDNRPDVQGLKVNDE